MIYHNAEYSYAECHILFMIMVNVIMLSVVAPIFSLIYIASHVLSQR